MVERQHIPPDPPIRNIGPAHSGQPRRVVRCSKGLLLGIVALTLRGGSVGHAVCLMCRASLRYTLYALSNANLILAIICER